MLKSEVLERVSRKSETVCPACGTRFKLVHPFTGQLHEVPYMQHVWCIPCWGGMSESEKTAALSPVLDKERRVLEAERARFIAMDAAAASEEAAAASERQARELAIAASEEAAAASERQAGV